MVYQIKVLTYYILILQKLYDMKSPKDSNSIQFQSNHLQQQPEFQNNEDNNIDRNQRSQVTSDDVGYEVSTNSLVTQHQNMLRPILCFKNIIKVLCILILSLLFYVGYMSFNKSYKQMKIQTKQAKTNTIEKQKDLIQPVDNKNDSFLIKNVQNTIPNAVILQIIPQIKENRPKNSELTKNNSQIVKHDNIQNAEGFKKSYNIKISEFPKFYIDGEDIQQFGIGKDIQIGSIYDYLNITHSTQFKNFKQNWQNQLKFQIYQYQYNLSLQAKQQVLEYTQFKNKNEMESYLNSLNQWNGKQNYGRDLPLYLSSHILWNPTNRKIQQIELYYLQKNYMLSNYPQELSICIFSTGYNIFSRDRHVYFLNSIEQQNYTNYHIVAVDDCSPDNTATRMYQYLNKTDSKLKNRIKIVRNIIKMGATASTYYWSKKLCRPGDIIVHVDMDDMLLGRQVFKVLNALYHNKNLWYVYTRYLRQDNTEMMPNAGKSRPMRHDVATYRYKLDWLTSAMRTLRYQIMANVPLQHVIQYHYNETTKQLMPKFYDTDADRFLIYSQLELCGNSRIQYIPDVFYYYNISNNIGGKCNMRHEHIDEYKSRIKTGVKPMISLQDKQVVFFRQQQVKIPRNVTKNLKDRYIKYKNCLNSR